MNILSNLLICVLKNLYILYLTLNELQLPVVEL